MKVTIRDQLAAALRARGYAEHRHKTSTRYTIMFHPTAYPQTVFLGKAGALRVGQTITNSIPSMRLRGELLAEWRASDKAEMIAYEENAQIDPETWEKLKKQENKI